MSNAFECRQGRQALSPRWHWLAAGLILLVSLGLNGCGGTIAEIIPQTSGTLSLSTSSLAFGSIVVGTVSGAQTFTVNNSGTATLTISSITASGDFAQTSSGCASLAVNASCAVSVSFMPTAMGPRTGTITLISNASSPQTVALTGTGISAVPTLSLSATSISFGTIVTGTSSAPWVLTATNTGNAALTISNISVSGAFSESSSGCSVTLAPQASCQISVIFSPVTAGALSGTLTIASNSAGAPQTLVALSGTGISAVAYTGVPFQVQVQAGSKPIAGAAVQFYAAGAAGNGSAPTSLLANALTTSAGGIVSVPAGYLCPSSGAQVYLVSRGGTVAGASGANANIVLMTAIGACNGIVSGSKFTVDEATSVAAVYALAQFYAMGGSVGATASNITGITNAFATAATLADPVAGTSPGTTLPGNASSPAARINSIANMLNACAISSTACGALYSATTQGTTVATNTLDAIFLLAKNPTGNVATLYTQSQASTAYAPYLSATPADWSMFVSYSGGGMDNPSGIGVDSKGNVWVASYFSYASKFTAIGAPVFANGITGDGLNNSYGLAIDGSDDVWIPNEQPFTATGIGTVTELTSAGVALSGAGGYTMGGMDYPLSVAIDPNGTVWVLDFGDSYLTLLNASGTPISGSTGYTSSLFAFPVAVALDANHFGWIVNQASNNVTKVAPDGTSYVNYDCCDRASGIAIDQGNNIWVADYFGDSVSLVTNSGTVIASNYTANGSMDHPQGIAVDGAGNVWVANYRASYLSELAGSTAKAPGAALTPVTGVGGDAALLEAYSLALDASGNIWVANQGSNTITKLIGLAVPVRTPLSGLPQLP